jgi:hypothetical protein
MGTGKIYPVSSFNYFSIQSGFMPVFRSDFGRFLSLPDASVFASKGAEMSVFVDHYMYACGRFVAWRTNLGCCLIT